MTTELEAFGQTLRELRKRAGLTQTELAIQLSVSPQLISLWERAYQYRGRTWKPDRQSALRLVEIFAGQMSPAESQTWISSLEYKLSKTELQEIFSEYSAQMTPADFQANLKRLEMLPNQRLFGVNEKRQQLCHLLEQAEAPWVITIDGIGGIGKTSLANALAHEIMSTNRFHDIAWVSAKQEEFLPGTGFKRIDRPALNTDSLITTLLEQLGNSIPLPSTAEEKVAILTSVLKEHSYLILIDNLETVADYQSLLPLLRKLANPSKFLITSRHNLHAYSDIFHLSLKELDQANTFTFLRYEAEMRGIIALANASQAQLESIYEVVGGNPLALKLVIGQISVLPLSQVLESLRQAWGKKIDELYTYIYWQAWHALDTAGRQLLLMMPITQNSTLAQLVAVSELETDRLCQALEQLMTLSLIEVGGDIERRRYNIHRLTETFLLTEVIKWQASS